jgi:glyoxylase-like metal-dependent hydrolase (beta-lactamase superfamily II)
MLVFDSLETGPIMTNCYILGDSESKVAAVVDPGGHVGAIRSALERHELECKWIVNTHAHFDHVGGNAELKQATGAEIIIHPAEAEALAHLSKHAQLFGLSVEDSPPADRTIEDGEVIEVGSLRLNVLHTPGHSPGGISLVVEGEKKILVGDLIFQGSIGRTDLPGGSFETLKKMADEKILVHSDDTDLYPGHGPSTTVGVEKRTNPFLTGELL